MARSEDESAIGHAMLYGVGVTFIDLGLYLAFFVVHALILRGFGVSAALVAGAYAVGWRFLCFQAPMQILFLGILRCFSRHRNPIMVVASGLLALVLSGLLYFADPTSIIGFFTMSNVRHLAEGLVLPVTLAMSWWLALRFRL
jgi:hypothetical protein